MKNINSIIKSHNTKTMQKSNEATSGKTCNCRSKPTCPLRGNCLVSNVVYKAKVTSSSANVFYIGLTGGTFKSRYLNHTKSFRKEKYQTETELSKYIWNLKRKNVIYSINWDIVRKSNTHRRDSGLCNLCMEEKLQILSAKDKLINKRSEL